MTKTSAPSSTFASTTARSFDPSVTSAIKQDYPAAGAYDEKRQLGAFNLQGGAPNNFLLLKFTKSAAPFTSTVPRF